MNLKSKFDSYFELTKPRIMSLVLVTTTLGYYLGGGGISSFVTLFYLLLGAACVCGGAGVLNHYLERDYDCKMLRTQNRPLPHGDIAPSNALSFGILLVLAGLLALYSKVNLLCAFLSLLTAFLYVVVYTPMKRVSWLNTTIGAIPGAIPPMGGWAAATGEIGIEAWSLFLILFFWQHPHFYAIAWMFKDDYKRAGFKMLPCIEPDGKSTFNQIFWHSIILIPVSILPAFLGMSGPIYVVGALISSLALLWVGMLLIKSHSVLDARKLLRATVIYLPLLLVLIVLDSSL